MVFRIATTQNSVQGPIALFLVAIFETTASIAESTCLIQAPLNLLKESSLNITLSLGYSTNPNLATNKCRRRLLTELGTYLSN